MDTLSTRPWLDTGHDYDFDSVMQYDGFACSNNTQPTIIRKSTGEALVSNNSLGLSEIDIDQINHLYQCADVANHKTSIFQFGQRLLDNFIPTLLSHQLQLLIGHPKWDKYLAVWYASTGLNIFI